MTTEIEEMLTRELREVARGVAVPPMPPVVSLEQARPPVPRLWQPLLVAAAVVLIIGLMAVALRHQGGSTPQPAPSPSLTPSVNATASPQDGTIPTSAPKVPYVFEQRLYVDGRSVPGTWSSVESRRGVWVAQQSDGSWWSGGPGMDTGRIDAQIEQPPAISPNGRYIAFVDVSGNAAHLTGFDTDPAGEGFGQAPVTLPRTEDGVPVAVRAVTEDGDVIVQGTRTSLMWRARFQDQQTVVDLSRTAPDQVVLQGTSAGLVVVDGTDGAVDATGTAPYLADLSPDGRLTTGDSLPTYDALEVSPGGTWTVRAAAGTLGGEVTSVATLDAQLVGGGEQVVLDAPRGWGFANGSWAWEDDETLVSVVLPAGAAGSGGAELVRCSVTLGACRVFPGPTAGAGEPSTSAAQGTATAEKTLDAVVRAVVAGDRGALLDPDVVGAGDWDQLVGYAAGGDGSGSTCRDNGGGTKDCEIVFAADRSTTYYAILEPAGNAYGWRITYVGVGGA